MLANPYSAKSEIVCDLNGFVSNFWRSIQNDPEKTAHYADWPTFHQDLTARHKWLVKWGNENIKLCEDPDFYDPKVAGWWCWGMSMWIGQTFCSLSEHVGDTRPHARSGNGVMKQRVIEGEAKDHSKRLRDWFIKLAKRFEKVVVLNRPWESAVTPAVLDDTDKSSSSTRAVFLDPPYLTDQRFKNLYQSDKQDKPDKSAQDSYDWAVSKGNDPDYKIAYCCGEGDFDIPQGWFTINQKFMGARNTERNDIIMFSPSCNQVSQQQTLF